jgi:hypothetical protein
MMKTYTVSICRVEHHIYELEVQASSREEAEELALETWDNDDEAFTHLGVVHAEEFTQDVKTKKEAA